jgi:hypothetical protein
MFGSERLLFAWLWTRAWLDDAPGKAVLRGRERGWTLIEFAIGALILVLGASVGLKMLSGDLSTFFSDLGKQFKLPVGGIGSGAATTSPQ